MVILSEIIEEGSSSANHDDHSNNHKQQQQRYDVFLSFRGADTRLRFTAHLYDALVKADISTFYDDQEIETGEDLKPELEDAIRSSRAFVVVLSENYATSSWCLDELALILEQSKDFHHIVIPIFYDVEPTDVRKQQNSFKKAMADHRKKMEAETNAEERVRWGQKIDRWTKALRDVANLKGKDVKGRREPELIEEIVIEIRQRLGVSLSDTLPLLIGRYFPLKEITSWLTDGSSSHTADILTILGMGGIGKTTLAKHVYHSHSRTFAKSCFIEGINSTCTGTFNGLLDVQKQLCDVISEKNKLRMKVFLVLDDIGKLEQLDVLLGSKGFHPGSKILITTRDASLTERCALFKSEVERKHTTLEIEGLYHTAALELLHLHAFNCNDPKEGYEEVIEKLVKYCEGHPLALEVLGKSLYNRDIAYWEACIENLKNETHSDIRTVLQMSFDSLPFPNDKELFKHIACFFVGIDREISEKILKACGIKTTTGVTTLIERCLLSIDQWGNRLMMHQLLQEMGKAMVLEESPNEPWNRSRLWCHDESFKVLKRKKGTDRVKGLVLDTRMLEKEKSSDLETVAFRNMDNLMILHLNYVQLSGSYKKFPKQIRWLRMHGFPLKSIPSDITMEKVVVLDMSYSKIKSFGMCYTTWQKVIGSSSKGKRVLGSLKILDLSFCEQLHKLCGFLDLPALERLIVKNCKRLIKICESLEECVELVHIDLSYCVKLEKLPKAIHKLKKVKKLLLDGWNTRESILQQLVPSVISFPNSLVRLSLADCNLSNESFPKELSCLSRLKCLWLDGNPIVSMPDYVRSLCSLEVLSMLNCYSLMSVEHPPCTLRLLQVHIIGKRLSWSYEIDKHSALQRISFHPDMSPINIFGVGVSAFRPWSYEIEGMVKIQALEGVEEKLLSTLGWTNLSGFLDKRQEVATHHIERGREQFQIQMYYEFGIFSTFYRGQLPMMMPDCSNYKIRSSKKRPTIISFTIPSSPNKHLRGLNLCHVRWKRSGVLFYLPVIDISNKTKNRTWIYRHCIRDRIDVGEGEWSTYISHWMFGMNEMEAGDHIIITIAGGYLLDQEKFGVDMEDDDDGGSMDDDDDDDDTDGYLSDQDTEKCGMGFVYEDDEDGRMEDEEEDALEYYKSWNHIIGGDLSSFQLETGEYFLSHQEFTRYNKHPCTPWGQYDNIKYKEYMVPFRAFSKRKSPK